MWWKFYAVFFVLFCSVKAENEDDKPMLRVMAKSTVYNVGEKKAIYCKGTNLKERLEWFSPSNVPVEGRSTKNNRVFTERLRDDPSNILIPLIIQSTQIKDSGNWTCKSGDLSEIIEILVGEKVIIEVRNHTLVGEEGKTVRLDCVAKGSPTPVVQWYKDVMPLSSTVDRSKYTIKEKNDNYQLEIRNLNHTDSGEYVCKVTQEALSYYTDKRVQLIVQHKPLLVDQVAQEENMYVTKYKTQEIYAILNETKNISCNTIAYPLPTFEWHKRRDGFDEKIPETDTIFKSENGTSSVLMLRMYNESYLGEYKCAAKNSKGSLSIIFHVSLGNKPSPPDSITWINATASELLFNVTCAACNLTSDDALAESPENLRVLGYSFQLTPVTEGFDLPDWNNAVELGADITDPENTLFSVGPLENSTKYYVRVRSRNAAGFSDWQESTEHPETTAFATKIFVSIFLLIFAFAFTRCY